MGRFRGGRDEGRQECAVERVGGGEDRVHQGKEPGSPDRPPPVRGWQPGDQTRADYTFGGTEEKTKEWFKAQPFPTLPGKATYA